MNALVHITTPLTPHRIERAIKIIRDEKEYIHHEFSQGNCYCALGALAKVLNCGGWEAWAAVRRTLGPRAKDALEMLADTDARVTRSMAIRCLEKLKKQLEVLNAARKKR